jgi:FkbM family methyltransferase
MQMIKSWVRTLAQRSGYRIVRANAFGANHLLDIRYLLRQRAAPRVFDVGANVGQTALKIKQLLPSATIYSFEPSPSTFQQLRTNCHQLAGWNGFNIGVGARNETLKLLENSHADMSSFLAPNTSAWGDIVRTVEVPVMMLDAFAETHNITQIDLLKTDTQGFDLEVFKGASQLMRDNKIGLIFCEIIFSDMYSGLPRFSEITDYLLDRNFELVGFYDMHYRNERIGWADALFINREFAAATPGPR